MKLLGLLVLLFSSSLWASGGYNFFTNASHIFHIPAHTLALIFGSLVFLAVGVYYRAKVSTVKNVVIPDKGVSVRNIVESLAQMMLRAHVQPPLPALAHSSQLGFQLESSPQLACHGVSPGCATHASDALPRS